MSLFTDEGALRSFCARILEWSTERAVAVEHALRSIEFAVAHRVALLLLGETDLVPIARALHRRMFGAERPFIVCDRRRGSTPAAPRRRASGRSPLIPRPNAIRRPSR